MPRVETAPKGQYAGFVQRLDDDLDKRKSPQDTGSLPTVLEFRQLKQENILSSSALCQRSSKSTSPVASRPTTVEQLVQP
mmetsp:Transcript_41059/g.73817  ORF Transcript_41059/g.73817 Transcript_41059/m.73817 type:complete len:80 (+) Transcript_41059:166-405(+)